MTNCVKSVYVLLLSFGCNFDTHIFCGMLEHIMIWHDKT